MMTPFEELIQQLGATLGVPLHIDAHGACCLQVNEKIAVQIEPESRGENVVIAAFISHLNPGKYREEVLKEALKANAHFIRTGNIGAILSFCGHRNQLACHTYVPANDITTEKLLTSLTYLTETAISWLDALQSGQTAPAGVQMRPSASFSPFGIRP
jgi:hypothetical protein